MTRSRLELLALVWVAVVVALVGVHVLLPQRFGAFALSQILEPYIVVTGLIAGVVAFRTPRLVNRALLLVALAIVLARYLPAVASFPPAPGSHSLQVSFWNIEAGNDDERRVLTGVASSNAQLIGLAELQPEGAASLERSEQGQRFASNAFFPDASVLGIGLLSQYPILEQETSSDPPYMRAVVDVADREPIVVYVVHPLPARFIRLGDIPVGVDTTVREVAIATIRSRMQPDIAAGHSVIVLGDINTTEREPAYAELSAGLRDAHLDAGVGPGFTWRPSPLSFLPFGLLRIDYVLTTPDLVPTSATVNCSLPSDHCRVDVDLMMTQLPTPD